MLGIGLCHYFEILILSGHFPFALDPDHSLLLVLGYCRGLQEFGQADQPYWLIHIWTIMPRNRDSHFRQQKQQGQKLEVGKQS